MESNYSIRTKAGSVSAHFWTCNSCNVWLELYHENVLSRIWQNSEIFTLQRLYGIMLKVQSDKQQLVNQEGCLDKRYHVKLLGVSQRTQ